MSVSILFYIGIVALTGLLFGKLAKLVKLPNVTGYLLGGLIIGPFVLGRANVNLLPKEALTELAYFSDIALGFIAFTIGTNFKFSYFKKVGAKPLVIAIFESLFAVLFVFLVLVIFKQDIKFALLLSAIAAATAPAATIMVIKQYKAKGNTTSTLMSVVALDDAVALILFGFAVAIVNSLGKSGETNIAYSIAKPFLEIIASLTIGSIMGLALVGLIKLFKGRSNRLIAIFAIVLLTASANSLVALVLKDFEISPLLSCMMIGFVFCNFFHSYEVNPVMELVDRFTPPIFVMFFVLSGASLDLAILPAIGLVGVIYIVVRVLGKMFGSWFGATITKCDKNVKKYLGLALLPQAGVAIGLTVVAGNVVPEYADRIRAVVLCATLIYELIGPAVSKFALTKAGDIQKEEKHPKLAVVGNSESSLETKSETKETNTEINSQETVEKISSASTNDKTDTGKTIESKENITEINSNVKKTNQ